MKTMTTTTEADDSINGMTRRSGDGVAQWVERRTRDPKTRGSNPVKSTRKMCAIFRVKNVVLTRCRCAQTPVCMRTRNNDHVRTLKIM